MNTLLEELSKTDLARLLIDNTPVAYIILDRDYRIHFINKNFLELRNLKYDEVLGEVCYNISNGGKQCRQCAVDRAIRTGRKAFISRKDTLPNGSVRFIDDYAIPLVKDQNGKTQLVLEIMVNRTPEMLIREKRDTDYEEILSVFSSILEAKDAYTATHSSNVRKVSVMLSKALNLSANEIFEISVAASLHDIGKIRIPYKIINKPGKLTDEEFLMIKKHPEISYDMIKDLSSFENIKNIVRQHHERIDGRGYPDGLSGDEISLGGKIVAVADTYDAITSTRSYRKALTHEYALEEIERVAGTQLDYDIVQTFINMDFTGSTKIVRKEEGFTPPIERNIHEKIISSNSKFKEEEDFSSVLNNENFLSKILENTPCGYVLMNTNQEVIYASKYFLSYMGLDENQVLGNKCYNNGGNKIAPCDDCVIKKAIVSGKVESARREQNTNNGTKIFDIFAMPILNSCGQVEYAIEVIIDRTKEILSERLRENDFNNLFLMLNSILDEELDDMENVTDDVLNLKEKLRKFLK